jgi:hypothetical protein
MSRPDQSITFLRQFGYTVLRRPRASAQPLDLLHLEGKDLSRLGDATGLVLAGANPVPAIKRDTNPGIAIEGKETSKVNVSIGLSVLGSFIGALGGGNLGLTAAFSKARTVTFQYAGVLEDRIDVLDLEKFVKAGRVDPSVPSGTVDKLIDDEIYVTTAVLKTKKIVVNAQSETGQSIGVDVPVIQGAVGGNVKVETGGTLASSVAFEGDVPIVFGLQAVQLVFDETGQFLTTQQLEPGVAAAGAQPGLGGTATAPVRNPVFLEPRGAFVRMAG